MAQLPGAEVGRVEWRTRVEISHDLPQRARLAPARLTSPVRIQQLQGPLQQVPCPLARCALPGVQTVSYISELGLETVRWRFFTGIVQFSRQILARTVNFSGLRCDLSPPIAGSSVTKSYC